MSQARINNLGKLGRLAHARSLWEYWFEPKAPTAGDNLGCLKRETSPAVRWYCFVRLTDRISKSDICDVVVNGFCDETEFWPLRKRLGDVLLNAPMLPSIHAAKLLKALRDKVAPIRWRAAELLRRIGVDATLVDDVVQELTTNACKHVRWRLAELIRDSELRPHNALTALLQATSSKDHWVQWHSRDVLRSKYDFSDILSVTSSPEIQQRPTLLTLVVRELCHRHPAHMSLPIVAQVLASAPEPDLHVDIITCIRNKSLAAFYISPLLQSLNSVYPNVRGNAARALGESRSNEPTIERALTDHMKNDNVDIVRMWSAKALIDLGHTSQIAINLLAPLLTDREYGLAIWNTLVSTGRHNTDIIERMADQSVDLSWLFAEDVAKGTLPSIGIKYWKELMPICLPTRDGMNSATHGGVYHSWESHSSQVILQSQNSLMQFCFHADWFPGIHLIWIADRILNISPSWDFNQSPVRIEGQEVGFLLQGGGNLWELPGMRRLDMPARADRIDFLFAADPRLIQSLIFAGLAAYSKFSQTTQLDEIASAVWRNFASGMKAILVGAGHGELANRDWFLDKPWHSSRYRARYERPYQDIQPALLQMVRLLEPRDNAVRTAVDSLVARNIVKLEAALWFHGLRKYPLQLLHSLLPPELLSLVNANAAFG